MRRGFQVTVSEYAVEAYAQLARYLSSLGLLLVSMLAFASIIIIYPFERLLNYRVVMVVKYTDHREAFFRIKLSRRSPRSLRCEPGRPSIMRGFQTDIF
jgi:hypothetical protein